MKVTNKEYFETLLNLFKLKIGDKVKAGDCVFEVIWNKHLNLCSLEQLPPENRFNDSIGLEDLYDIEYEVLKEDEKE